MADTNKLPPLNPDAYLVWLWNVVKAPGEPWTLSEYALNMDITVPEARRRIVSSAAWTRKRMRFQRLGITYLPTTGKR